MTATDAPVIERIERAYARARELLLSHMKPAGYWEGRLSSSALSTATAVSAFAILQPTDATEYIVGGVRWLADDQNEDGGWGDSPSSPSNIPTSMLVEAALNLAASLGVHAPQACLESAEGYLNDNAGRTGSERVRTVEALYGSDRTFAVPILINCAFAPAPDDMKIPWNAVPPLPFELAALPRSLFRVLHLRVVSYALPALIAIGQLIHSRKGTRNPISRLMRNAASAPTLRLLESIQPASGGFLEAVPLTAFVTMSLAASGHAAHPVVRKGIGFLKKLVRPDGSWPIDANLATWLTSLSVEALSTEGRCEIHSTAGTREWFLAQQHLEIHSYTNVRPGGWAWTDLSGGVPDTDDTSGALIALSRLDAEAGDAVHEGISWLLDMQNRDGGWPTFCRGWGRLPFDRSAADLTAHALHALWTWRHLAPRRRLERTLDKGFRYLGAVQREDGAWEPMWFGNQSVPGNRNPVYGTARVLDAYCEAGRVESPEVNRAIEYLLGVQNSDGGWGGDRGAPVTVEETALATGALCKVDGNARIVDARRRGAAWLVKVVEDGGLAHPAPIGLYFARLWYAERLYPVIWTVEALGRMLALVKHS